ncbi:MAG: DNA polymerase I [Calditrichia bacterium]
MSDVKRLFLIDGSALFYRSYFAFIRNPLINSKGQNTSAIFGFAGSLLKILLDESPDYIGVVFDTKEPTFRHEQFPEYKATREKMPEEMREQYPQIVELVKAFNIPVLEKPGFEADDIIATLAKKAEKRGLETFMVTSDKDFMQLLTPNIRMYSIRPGSNADIIDIAALQEKHGLTPEQVIDYLALMGDKSDNVPGVPGIGEKTAKALLQQFGSLDNIYANLDQVPKPGWRKKLEEGRDSAYLSRQLVTIKTDVPLDFDFEKLVCGDPNAEELRSMFELLEFNVLMRQLDRYLGQGKRVETIESSEKNYQLIRTRQQLAEIAEKLQKSSFFVFDTETTGLRIFESDIIGIALCLKPAEAFYVPLNDPQAEFSAGEALEALQTALTSPRIGKGGQNIKFDGLMLAQHQIDLQGIRFDTMVAHYLINPGSRQHKLDVMAERYLNYKMVPIEDLIGPKGKKQKNMQDIPVEQVYPYACEDADITYRLMDILKKQLEETGTMPLFRDVEMPLVEVLMQMEKNGVKLDVSFLKGMSDELAEQLATLEKEITEIAGEEFNLNSPQQLGKVLFEVLEIHKEVGTRKPSRTPTGQYSTSEAVLEKYSNHPIVAKILEYRKLMKLKGTYVDALPSLISPRTGRLHASFNQTITATGRLSSSDPNLQNIPIRTEEGRKIRQAFIPEDQKDFIISADYSQIELRMMAHLSEDPNMISAFQRGEDIHATTAAAIYNIPIEMVTPDQRRKAKEVNFGIIYGISPYGLASRLNIPVDEAKGFIQKYFERFERVQLYMNHAIAEAKQHKYVTTILNRRRYIPEIDSKNQTIRQNAERAAINTTIQGSAADLIKLAMIEIHKAMQQQGLKSRMILQVHDELVFEVVASELETMKKLVKEKMENAQKLKVPLKVDLGVGKNWMEAH